MRLILASASPRRAELIKKVAAQFEGLSVSILPSAADERVFAGETPEGYAVRAAKLKAAEVASRIFFTCGETRQEDGAVPDAVVVLGCDTVVALDGQIFGKPADAQEAEGMFRALCGKTHDVITGVCLMRGGKNAKSVGAFQKTRVRFGAYNEALVRQYILTDAPFDKAGGYGLQDPELSALIRAVEGETDNVVGLPVRLVTRLLRETFLTDMQTGNKE